MLVHKKVQDDSKANSKAAQGKALKERDPLESTEEEDPEALIEKIDLKEVDRLLYHIMAIENDCAIVPQGSMKLTPKHEVQRNEAFRGLNSQQFLSLDNYSHFRVVQDASKREALEADDAIFNKRFLDEVIDDQPQGCWSVQKDGSGQVAVIRNNLWRGFTAYHRANSQEFGYVYVGDGLKTVDFQFML